MIKRIFSSVAVKYPITITNYAWDKMTEILKQKNKAYFIFSAASGGCNGFNYNLKLLDDEKYKQMRSEKSKITISHLKRNEANVIIDPMSEMFLLGTTIDYICEDYDNGIFESKFVFMPDKEFASSCGCGISFTPKD
jgi:iron-sulfur cluster assembly accessory protein